jgi:hypothetical protein
MKKSQRLMIEAGFSLAVIAASTLHSLLIVHQRAKRSLSRALPALRDRFRGQTFQ